MSEKNKVQEKAAKLETSLTKEIEAEKQAEKVIHAAELAKANAEKSLTQAKKDKTTLEQKIKLDMRAISQAVQFKTQLEVTKRVDDEQIKTLVSAK